MLDQPLSRTKSCLYGLHIPLEILILLNIICYNVVLLIHRVRICDESADIHLKVTLMTDVELILINIVVATTIICRPHALIHDIVILFYSQVLLRLMLSIVLIASIYLIKIGVLHCEEMWMVLFLNFCGSSSNTG